MTTERSGAPSAAPGQRALVVGVVKLALAMGLCIAIWSAVAHMVSDVASRPSPSSSPALSSAATSAQADDDAGDDLTPAIRAAVEKWRDAPPAGAPELGDCEQAFHKRSCRNRQGWFVAQDWARAHKGGVESMRTVAWCTATGCDSAFVPKPVEGCAWAWVVVGEGTKRADEDAETARRTCQSLDNYQMAAARARALELVHQLP